MCKKSVSVAYYSRKIKISSRSAIIDEIMDSPLSQKDVGFMIDILDGLSIIQLAEKYQKSKPRISQWKRSCFEKLHRYNIAILN